MTWSGWGRGLGRVVIVEDRGYAGVRWVDWCLIEQPLDYASGVDLLLMDWWGVLPLIVLDVGCVGRSCRGVGVVDGSCMMDRVDGFAIVRWDLVGGVDRWVMGVLGSIESGAL